MPGLSALERNRPARCNAQVTSACRQYGIRKSRCQRSGCAPDLPVIGVSFYILYGAGAVHPEEGNASVGDIEQRSGDVHGVIRTRDDTGIRIIEQRFHHLVKLPRRHHAVRHREMQPDFIELCGRKIRTVVSQQRIPFLGTPGIHPEPAPRAEPQPVGIHLSTGLQRHRPPCLMSGLHRTYPGDRL